MDSQVIPTGDASRSAPPTVIVVHRRERRSKCSVEPLRRRPGFVFWKYPGKKAPLVASYVRLGMEGPQLGESDCASGLLVLDGTWRLAAAMEKAYSEIPVRALPVLQTAYPRLSKVTEDPSAGLATIEALFAALLILGRETAGILDSYAWRDDFLARNRAWILETAHKTP